MKFNIKVNPETDSMPRVGQLWRHQSSKTAIYMRIPDYQGMKALGMEKDSRFFSVSLSDGQITYTRISDLKDNSDYKVILLEQEEECKLKEV